MIDLNSLLPSSSGWTLSAAYSINDSGQITGYGIIDGESHAFILSSPIQQLVNIINGLNVPIQIKAALLNYVAQLPTAIASLSDQQKSALRTRLQRFISFVQMSGIPASQATLLMSAATALIAALS